MIKGGLGENKENKGSVLDKGQNKKKEYRNIAIYLIKKYTGLTNRELGKVFGNISCSAIAKAYQRFSRKVEKDMVLKKKVGEITTNMSNVKG